MLVVSAALAQSDGAIYGPQPAPQTPEPRAAKPAPAPKPAAPKPAAPAEASAPTAASPSGLDNDSRTECHLGANVRFIDIKSPEGAKLPCEVIYTKETEGVPAKTLWGSASRPDYCESRASELVEKLRGMGWSCEP